MEFNTDLLKNKDFWLRIIGGGMMITAVAMEFGLSGMLFVAGVVCLLFVSDD